MTIIKLQNKISHKTKVKKFHVKGEKAMKLIVSAHGMLAIIFILFAVGIVGYGLGILA